MRRRIRWQQVNSFGYGVERLLAWIAAVAAIAVALLLLLPSVPGIESKEVGCSEELTAAEDLTPIGSDSVRAEFVQELQDCSDVVPPLKAGLRWP